MAYIPTATKSLVVLAVIRLSAITLPQTVRLQVPDIQIPQQARFMLIQETKVFLAVLVVLAAMKV